MTLQSNDMIAAAIAANADLEAIARGIGRGDAGIGEYFVTFAEQVASGIRTVLDTTTVYENRFAWSNAEAASKGREPQEMPQGNSKASQIAKAKNFAYVGERERVRTGLIAILRAEATRVCGWKYTPMVAGTVAMVALYDADNAATDADLKFACETAMRAAMSDKVKNVETELAKIVKAWDKLAANADYSPALRAAGDHYGLDMVANVSASLTKLASAVGVIEGDKRVRRGR